MAITTHVIDTANGRPASGVPVKLDIFEDDDWILLAEGATDAEGRLKNLTDDVDLRVGIYRLTFDSSSYFRAGFFLEVSIVFEVSDPAQHYHVPLLLSPFGYSTYRGS